MEELGLLSQCCEDRETSRGLLRYLTTSLTKHIKMRSLHLLIGLAVIITSRAATPELRFAWKQVDYVWETPEQKETAVKDGTFVQATNLPLGLARWKNKLFVTVPRWKNGVASSLNYVDVDGAQDQLLKPYPSLKDNLVPDTAKELPSNSSIISVFRVFVDACDRLWVMDSGLADILGSPNQVAGPSIVIFDLNTDQLLHRYFFKVTDMKEDSYRTMFFHAFASTKEFCVSTELLRNYSHIDKNEAFHDFKVDDEDTLWILSDKLPRYMFKSLDANEVNYRIFSINVKDAIAGTACE
ncbi:unnamed protein product [Leptidea sinapis]|uniref:Protein yellow n=1 Tax=Leptidea sinapis TaxID=189913 RepID=A0A5E4QGA5_9NEOP|nr:unnamed protein product [Leptidea sinapis]